MSFLNYISPLKLRNIQINRSVKILCHDQCIQGFASLKYSPSLLINKYNVFCLRTVITPASINMIKYVYDKNRNLEKLKSNKEYIFDKMNKLLKNTGHKVIFYLTDIENVLHLSENSEDIHLLIEMIRRYCISDSSKHSQIPSFGTEVMRLYYHLNMPLEALKVIKDEELRYFFKQVTSYSVVMSLLYDSGYYEEVIELMKQLIDERISIILAPKVPLFLTLAACYKLNSEKCLEDAISFLKKSNKIENSIQEKCSAFCAALALNQNRPDVALEIISKAKYLGTILKNIKLQAFLQQGNISDVLSMLRGTTILVTSAQFGPNGSILDNTLLLCEESIKDNGDEKDIIEFNYIKDDLKKKSLISDETLDNMLCTPVYIGRMKTDREPKEYSKMDERDKRRALLSASLRKDGST